MFGAMTLSDACVNEWNVDVFE